MEAKATADAEKFEKLKEKYNQLKQANTVLKKGLLDKQEECAQKEKQVKEKETTIRQQLEEIDHLQFQNGRMSKQMGTLNDQVENLQKQKQNTGLSVQGFFSGKQQQEAIQNAENEIKVLRDELVTKIEENEDLHMKMYECKQEKEEEIQQLRDASAKTASNLDLRTTELENERDRVRQLSADNKSMVQRIKALEEELETSRSAVSSVESKLEQERQESKKQVDSLLGQLARWVPFDDAAYSPWNLWNCTSRHGREAQWRREASRQFQACVVEACKQNSVVLEMWAKTFSIGGDGESAKRLKMRNKMAEIARKLATMVGETVPELIVALARTQMRPTSLWDRHFKQCFRSLLQTQRQWIVYQSLLLLHDSSGIRSTRSAKEESQAQSFVDCLWRLHRCMRILFSKMRIFFCVSLLTTQCGSSMHFLQAREALGCRQFSGQKGVQDRASNGIVRRNSSGLLSPGGTRVSGYTGSDGICSDAPLSPRARSSASTNHVSSVAENHLSLSNSRLVERMHISLKDVSQCWEGIARCLSSWATAQKGSTEAVPDDGNGVVSLLESLHGLCACIGDRVLPAVDSLLAEVPCSVSSTALDGHCSMWGLNSNIEMIVGSLSSSRNTSSSLCLNRYTACAGARLLDAPGSIGFDESSQTQVFVRQLAAEKGRLSGEVRQQIKRLREVSNEKGILADELRALQDNHALLRSNLQVLKEKAVQRKDDDVAGLSQPDLLCTDRPGSGDLVLTSRQRALLESLSVTSQESSSLRQHGFFCRYDQFELWRGCFSCWSSRHGCI
jgi:hypothetical protein